MARHSRIFDRRSRPGARLALTATQILMTIAVCVIEVIALSATAQPDSLLTSVTAVTDGDTIRIGRRRVSLLGITAPRLSVYEADPLARAARDRLASLVLVRFVRLEYDGPRGRAYVSTEDGVFVNAEIVRAGLARVTGPPTLKRIAALRAAEADARAARRGIWRSAERVREISLGIHPARPYVVPHQLTIREWHRRPVARGAVIARGQSR